MKGKQPESERSGGWMKKLWLSSIYTRYIVQYLVKTFLSLKTVTIRDVMKIFFGSIVQWALKHYITRYDKFPGGKGGKNMMIN